MCRDIIICPQPDPMVIYWLGIHYYCLFSIIIYSCAVICSRLRIGAMGLNGFEESGVPLIVNFGL